jgi:hypothetical protein
VFNPIDCLLLGDVYMDGWIDAVTILYVWVNNGKLSTSSYEKDVINSHWDERGEENYYIFLINILSLTFYHTLLTNMDCVPSISV